MASWNGRRLIAVLAVCALVVCCGALIRSPMPSPVESSARDTQHASIPRTAADTAQATASEQPAPATHTNADSAASVAPHSQPSLVEEYRILSVRAQQGDAIAGSTLYRDVEKCLKTRAKIEQVEMHIRVLEARRNNPESTLTSDGAEEEDRWLANWHDELHDAQQAGVFCNGSDAILADPIVFAIRLQAAKLGDSEAAGCYIVAQAHDRAYRFSAEVIAAHRTNALALMEDGMHKGDWRMVQFMYSAYRSSMSAPPLGSWRSDADASLGSTTSLLYGDAPTYYRYLKLLSLGDSRTEESESYSDQLARITQQLDSSDIAQADAWAKQAYADHFRYSSNFQQPVCPD